MKNSKTLSTQNESVNSLTIHTLTNENFNLLLKAQELIKLRTGFFLSIQKLINLLFTQFTTQELIDQFLKTYSKSA